MNVATIVSVWLFHFLIDIVYLGVLFCQPYYTSFCLLLSRTTHMVVISSIDILRLSNFTFSSRYYDSLGCISRYLSMLTQIQTKNCILCVNQTMSRRIRPNTIVIRLITGIIILNHMCDDIDAIQIGLWLIISHGTKIALSATLHLLFRNSLDMTVIKEMGDSLTT